MPSRSDVATSGGARGPDVHPAKLVRAAVKSLVTALAPWGPVAWRLSGRAPHVALTFDDGPHPEITPRILDTLKKAGAVATFYIVGERASEHPEIVHRMIAEGHTLGWHTETHADLSLLPFGRAWQECHRARRAAERTLGSPIPTLRPPWGKMRPATVLLALVSRIRLTLWSVDSLDWRGIDAAEVLENIRRSPVCAGDILLFHDDRTGSAEALPAIIAHCRALGLGFTTIRR